MKYITLILSTCLFTACLVAGTSNKEGQASRVASPIQFQEIWRVGPDNDEDLGVWGGAGVVARAAKNGEVYVLDPAEQRLVVISADGKIQRTIGGKGEGPGEFINPTNFSILADGSFVVSENRQGLHVRNYFDAAGKFVERKDAAGKGISLEHANVTPSGNYIDALTAKFDQTGAAHIKTGLYDTNYEEKINLTSLELPALDPAKITTGAFWVNYLSVWFSSQPRQGLVTFANNGDIYTCVTDKYEITRYDSQLNKQGIIQREYKPKPLPEEQLQAMIEPIHEEVLSALPPALSQILNDAVVGAAIEAANLPRVKPPIFGIVPLEKGVLVAHDHNPLSGATSADYFDEAGTFVGSVDLPPVAVNLYGAYHGVTVRMTVAGNRAYVIEKVDGDLNLVAYDLKLQ